MEEKETLIRLICVTGENLVFNLDFIPDDRFAWRPSSAAKSALEIVNHILENFNHLNGLLGHNTPEPPVDDIEGAKRALRNVLRRYEQGLRHASPDQLSASIQMPGMAVTVQLLVRMAVIDLLHHHGQVTYIQTLLLDEESHFAPGFFAQLD